MQAIKKTMVYIPKDIKVPPLYSTENHPDPIAWVKFFTPDSFWSWFVVEYDGQDLCFGLAQGFFEELGYFSLQEMREARGPLGLPIERDLWFTPVPLSKVKGAR